MPNSSPNRILALALALFGASFSVDADTLQLGGVQNHWVANTGGKLSDHVQNFLTDMVVYYNSNDRANNPLLLAASFWDEGGFGYGAYADGKSMGKAEWWKDTIHSDRAWYKGQKCQINHFWGRAFTGKTAPPPKGESAPFVSCSNGDTIRTVTDPTALTFDRSGHLLVADNGPDQNVKIFALHPPRLLRTFGDSGGVFAASKPGAATAYIPGAVGPRRFWGIRGLAVDTQGNLFVGNTGMSEQTMGGTDIRGFSASDSTPLWQVQGLSFVNNADADPASGGKDLYLNAKHFRMDYSKSPGASWRLVGVTLDPFRFPDDPRLTNAWESVWERRIGGKRFQYHTNMYGSFVYVVRFNDESEIGIPTAYFCTGSDQQSGWGSDSAPTWTRNETNKRLRWYWVDRNGDGIAQKNEYGTFENWNSNNQGIDVDEAGDIWLGGKGTISTYYRSGGTTRIPAGGLGSNGIPRFRLDSLGRYDISFAENRGWVSRLKYVASKDAMFLATGPNAWYSNAIYRYDHYSDSASRTQTCRVDLGYQDNGAATINLDVNTATMTLPWSFTADSDYVYVTYLDKGRYSRARGEVTVYDARNCQSVGWMAPGPETGNFSGAVDMVNALNVATEPDGHKIVMVEEDGAGKVMVYRWQPQVAVPSPPVQSDLAPVDWRVLWNRTTIRVLGPVNGGKATLFDITGQRLASWTLPPIASGEASWITIPSGIRPTALGILQVEADGHEQSFQVPNFKDSSLNLP